MNLFYFIIPIKERLLKKCILHTTELHFRGGIRSIALQRPPHPLPRWTSRSIALQRDRPTCPPTWLAGGAPPRSRNPTRPGRFGSRPCSLRVTMMPSGSFVAAGGIGWDGNPPKDVGGVFVSILTKDTLDTERPIEHPSTGRWAPTTEITTQFHCEHKQAHGGNGRGLDRGRSIRRRDSAPCQDGGDIPWGCLPEEVAASRGIRHPALC